LSDLRQRLEKGTANLLRVVNSTSSVNYDRTGRSLINSMHESPFLSYCYKQDYQAEVFSRFLSFTDVDVCADLTLKKSRMIFSPLQPNRTERVLLTEALASVNLVQFMSFLNYSCFKHAYKRYGKKLTMHCSLEGMQRSGASNGMDLREYISNSNQDKHLHMHIVFKKPEHLSFEDFQEKIGKCWERTDYGNRVNQIEEIRDANARIRYNLKSGLDATDLENLNLS
jgi:hypothetical protein